MTEPSTSDTPAIDPNLTEITVWFLLRAMDALNAAAARQGMTHTDTINRAVIFYDYFYANLWRYVLRGLAVFAGVAAVFWFLLRLVIPASWWTIPIGFAAINVVALFVVVSATLWLIGGPRR